MTRDEDAQLSTAKVVRQRDGETGDKIHFGLDAVMIGENNETGEEVTSCVVAAPDAAQVAEATRHKEKRGKAEQIALNALECVIEAQGTKPPAAANCPSERWVREEVWRTRCYDDGISSGKARAQQIAYQGAVKTLTKEKLVGTQDGFVWLEG